MSQEVFELIAEGLRYWIAALVVYILFRSAMAVRRSFVVEKRERKQSEGGYTVGVLEVIDPGQNPRLMGARFVLRQENRIGSGGDCDIRIRERSVRPTQATIYQKGQKIFISDYGTRAGIGLNGFQVQEDVPLMDGDEIQISGVVLALSLKSAFSAGGRPDMNKGDVIDNEEEWDDEDEESFDDDADDVWDEYDGDENNEYDDEHDEYDPDDDDVDPREGLPRRR